MLGADDSDTTDVVVGVIRRPHGLRGEVTVEPRTDEPARRFAVGQVLHSENGSHALTVAAARDNSGRLRVQFVEVGDRTEAEEVRGLRLVSSVNRRETPSDPDEFYDWQLIGLRVLNAQHAEVGEVSAVVHPGAQDLLEVTTAHGTRLVPFVAALVPVVDLAAGFVRLADVDGLLSDPEGA